jgi:cyclic beta-1,2-glucan synthetase
MTYRNGAAVYEIEVQNPGGVNMGVREVLLDGRVLADGVIPLSEEGEYEVVVVMG